MKVRTRAAAAIAKQTSCQKLTQALASYLGTWPANEGEDPSGRVLLGKTKKNLATTMALSLNLFSFGQSYTLHCGG
jgi:hypothetical protein